VEVDWQTVVSESNMTAADSQMDVMLVSGALLQALKSQGFKVFNIEGSIAKGGSVKDKVEVIDPSTGRVYQDTEAPLLILRGEANTELVLSADGIQFIDPGASAIDKIDGDLSPLIRTKLLNGTDMDINTPTLPNSPYVIRSATIFLLPTALPSRAVHHLPP
jgi:hypothetical protein